MDSLLEKLMKTRLIEPKAYVLKLVGMMGMNVDNFVSKIEKTTLCKELLLLEWGLFFCINNISIKNAIFLLEEVILPNEIQLECIYKTTDEILTIIRQHYHTSKEHSNSNNKAEKRTSPQGFWQKLIIYIGISKKNDL